MPTKYASSGSAIRATSQGLEVIASPCRANSSTMVNSRPYMCEGADAGQEAVFVPVATLGPLADGRG